MNSSLLACLVVVALAGSPTGLPSAESSNPDATASPDTPAPASGGPVTTASTVDEVVELKFGDFFKRPVGPRGLEFTETLLGCAGRRVCLEGYMIRQSEPQPRCFLFAPRPVRLHEHEYGLADELPASTVHVFTSPDLPEAVPFTPGLLRLTGTLELGNRPEPDGRTSLVRLRLDPPTAPQREAWTRAAASQAATARAGDGHDHTH